MKFDSLKAAIDFAIEREKEAARIYEEAGEVESAAGSKEIFRELAREERKHREFLENIEKEDVGKGVGEYKLKWISDMHRSDYLVDLRYEKGMAYRDILILAMKREEKSLKLYNDLLRSSTIAAHKKLFKILCQEEAKHKLRLETLYDDYMAKMGD